MTARRRVIRTSEGTTAEAFGPPEWGLLSIAAVVWGSSFLFIAQGLETFAPGLITWLRVLLGIGTLSLFPAARRPIDRSDVPAVLLLGAVWMAAPLTLLPIAQQSISSALAGMINGAMPLFAAAFAALLLRRLPGSTQLIGLVVGFAGVLIISAPSADTSGTLGAILLTILTVAFYGFAVNLAVPLQQRYGALPILLRALAVAAVLTTPLGVLGIGDSTYSTGSLLAVVALGVGGTGVAYVAMSVLVGRAGATRGSIAIYFMPLVAIVLGVWVRNDAVTGVALVGMALVLVGAFVTSRAER